MVNKVKLGINNLYLFENNNGDYLLLDTGLACKENLILNKINKVIGDYNKIKVIVITHSHSDHIGNLKLLLDKIKREDKIVIIHSNAKDIMLSGEKIIPNGFYKFSKYISKKLKAKSSGNFQKGFENLEEKDFKDVNFLDFKDYEEFSLNKYGFENLKVIYTAGHSNDSISLVYNDEYLFCGDMVQNLFFKYPLIPLFGDDIKELVNSWKKVIDKDYSRIYPATSRSYILRGDLIKKLEKYE
ncbi:MBL fold metallo-hydrolase [Fusobacterium polymorphum]|jgi:metallo-beta-lactamase family protein|uniref:MBL fold hydrolase n=1 Tax=Fusobacterium nucleatum subsp. polymorphum TaxID=76857 RepID=A0A241PZ51_FUSNP|nr:MBL fold metallo-hydrolase [Fusobacterium polymorphum]ALM93800.1 MBL fold metallo-hydrolase [Fusobacterium polymorphum]ASG27843.1 MBL fold hydrolase [Fusobacterium polymorphum]QYR62320.1 MBL fold metallo-hydrolase [Fusobacterium polymorphum]